MDHPLIARRWIGSGDAAVVLPDGCADLVWTGGRLVVAGPATRPVAVPAMPGQPRFGVRLRAGGIEAALGVPAEALRDLDVPVAELWGRGAQERVARAAERGAREGVAALAELVTERARDEAPDRLVREAAWRLRSPKARLPVVAAALGIGERQLRRRFDRTIGYGWRTFARVQRFQRLLLAHERFGGESLAWLAAEAGYADQAHMTREVRRLSGRSPSSLLSEGPRAAGERSESFKTAAQRGRILTA